ncbi:eukaryotic translation initiation factor 3 subunit 10 [Aphelenchoides avenae]|nr:eukaryotic translation initiation factor 3 subunit 10 [Aphelenchus avenae]
MRPTFFQKPEAALQRAHEFISVGKEQDALQSLHDMIKDRRQRQWTEAHEKIMMLHVELCVNLRNTGLAKDGLYQYKMLTQNVAVQSLVKVMDHFLQLAESKTEQAQKDSQEKAVEVDDLDSPDAPESLLLSAVSGAVAQDRMDRTVLSPWLRFLWDSYRNCLDLLRNNCFVEQLYHQIAHRSFSFCARYQRRNEFRKLCDLLRMHLTQIQKNQQMNHAIKLSSMESLSLMQETRLKQLDTAIQMELWQEAYKSAEDLHNMMQLSKDKDKRMVKPASYVNYYDKLALVFWKGGNTLFHAAALLQKFNIYKDMKKTFSEEEALDQATRVLLATMCIPDGADAPSVLTKHLDIEDQHLGNIRVLAALLRLPVAPTRAGLLREIARLNIPEMASPTARNLYNLIEVAFTPLRIASRVQTELGTLETPENAEYSQYVNSLRSVVATRVLKQVTVIYDTLSIERLQKVIPFYSHSELERFVVDVSKRGFVKAQIDHRQKCIRFGPVDATLAGDVETDYNEEPQSGLESVRTHLESLYNQLKDAVYEIDGTGIELMALEKLKRHITIYGHHKQEDYERMLMRRKKIENYKETNENLKKEKLKEVEAEKKKAEEQRRHEEAKRLEQENKENERKRKLADQKEVENKVRAEQMKRLQQNPLVQEIIKQKGLEIIDEMDPQALIREQRERMDAERRQQMEKLQQQEKKFDHQVRAFHLEEIHERKKRSDEYLANAPTRHEEYEKRRVAKAIEEHEKAIVTFERLQKCRGDAEQFLENVIESHRQDFANQLAAWEKSLADAKQRRLKERANARKKERRQQYEAEKAEQERAEADRLEKEKQDAERARRAASREDRGLPKVSDEPSKADEDMQWRKAVPDRPPQQPLQRIDNAYAGGGPPARENGPAPPAGGAWRREPPPPQREAAPPPQETVADKADTWRGAGGPARGVTIQQRPGGRMGGPGGPPEPDFGNIRNRPRHAEPEQQEQSEWRRGAPRGGDAQPPLQQRQPEQPAEDGGNWRTAGGPKKDAAAPAATKPGGKYVPPSQRNKQ